MFLFTKWGSEASNIEMSLMKTNIGYGNKWTCREVLVKKSISFNSHSVRVFFPVCGHIGPEGHKTPGLLIFVGPIIHPSISYTCLSCLKGVKPLSADSGRRVNLDRSHMDRETLTFTLTGGLVFSSPPPRVVDRHLLTLLSTAVTRYVITSLYQFTFVEEVHRSFTLF